MVLPHWILQYHWLLDMNFSTTNPPGGFNDNTQPSSTSLTTMTSLPIDVITTTHDDTEDESSLLPLPWSAVAIVCIGVAIATAVGGNMLILLSYWRDPLLRDVHNLYLVHLAVCDCLTGLISMPLYLIYTVMRWKWILGEVMCKVFLVTDFTFAGNSVYIVVLVAYDRLALVTSGADYKTTQTRCRAYFKLTACWLFSFFLFSPAILLWEIISGRSVVPPDDCDTEFHQHFVFVIVTEVISFAFPFFSLTVISVLLFFALRKRSNKVGVGQKSSLQDRQSSGQRRQSPEPVQQGTVQLGHSSEQVRNSPNQLRQRPMQLRRDSLQAEHSFVQSRLDPETLRQSPECIQESPERLRERPEHVQQVSEHVQNKQTSVTYSLEKTEYKQDHTQQNHDTMCTSPDPIRQFVETVRLNAQRLSPPRSQNSHLHLSPLRLPNSCPVTNESDGQTETRSDVENKKLQSSEIQNSEENGRVWMTKSTETLNIPKSKTAGQDGSSSEQTRHMEPLNKGHSKQNGATSQAEVPLSTTTLREGLSTQEEIIKPPESGCSNGHGTATQKRIFQLEDKEKDDAHPGPVKCLESVNDRNDVAASTVNPSPPYSTVRGSSSTQAVNLRSLDERRERRVALILAGLVLALVVFWLPYTISTIVLATCEECVNKDLYEFFNWLLWLKSCVNPFLYAYMSPRFRKNFQKLLGPLCPQVCRK